MRINDFDTNDRTLVIAEIGNNHEGQIDVAKRLVEQAAECKVDAVKFQTFQTDAFVSPFDSARVERMRKFELSPEQFSELRELTHSLGMLFISTPLDMPSVKVLTPLVDAFKIASGDNDFFPLIQAVCETGLPLIVSSGVTDLKQIAITKSFIEQVWEEQEIDSDLAVLHCVSNYPTQNEDANLLVIDELRNELEIEVGYSDHTLGNDACVVATALGASIIEKHFTLDKNFSDFRDHAIAADPPEMAQLVKQIRKCEKLLGSRAKRVLACEKEMAGLIRRSIVADKDLPAGHCLTMEDLTWMRPGNGLQPGKEEQLIGQRLSRDVRRGESIELKDVA